MDAPAPPAPPAVAAASATSASAPAAWSATAYGPGAVTPAAQWAPPVARPQNVLAWVSLGLGLGSLMFGLLSSIPAIICGHIARRQLRERGEQGEAAALTGLISGYVISALWVLGIAAYALFFVALFAAAGVSTGVGSGL